jgi:hypothetical protein
VAGSRPPDLDPRLGKTNPLETRHVSEGKLTRRACPSQCAGARSGSPCPLSASSTFPTRSNRAARSSPAFTAYGVVGAQHSDVSFKQGLELNHGLVELARTIQQGGEPIASAKRAGVVRAEHSSRSLSTCGAENSIAHAATSYS